jgi:hypothetical protein
MAGRFRGGQRGRGVVEPAVGRPADRDAGVVAGDVRELAGVGGVRDDVPGAAALDPVDEVSGAERRRRRHDDRAELHDGEHRLPQLDLVAEHEDHAVALAHPLVAQPVGDLVGAGGQRVEGVLGRETVLLDDVQPDAVVADRVGVEPVDRPVERAVEGGPAELGDRLGVVAAQREELVAGGAVGVGRRAGHRGPPRDSGCRLVPTPPGR